ncbi:hypothetical protein L6E12_16255 [Actinokineospora sp. PR83]|uniref:DAPG hydrolase family protein n=1 Tax=Actinokineospora sp. PR83 TaxID=2884908 RepID=UPI001F1A8F9C|nr:hypothetical protein [Actinokineospora sp. PR83]MCG8917340.1 hypothetical protein [Actinokineospora sp. PR83]
MAITRRTLLRTATAGALVAGTGVAVSPAQAATAAPGSGLPSTIDVDEPRYLGYKPADRAKPYAKYMRPSTLPAQQHVADAYFGDPVPADRIPAFDRLADDLNRTGYSPVETGYGTLADGRTVWAAALTTMPGVTAAMWDWWFGWHSAESARYRLWHPDAHAYAALLHDTTTAPGLTDRQRYVGNTSFVDEFIGGQLEQLAITFLDPAEAGLRTSDTTTVIHGRVASAQLPVSLGYLSHQVRPAPGGAEMRSRFYLNLPGVNPVDLRAALAAHNRGEGPALAQPLPFTAEFGRSLMEHCGREMNHLASFLPQLYADHH